MDNSLPFPQGTRVVAYLRDSGGRDQNLSVMQQEKAVGEYCRTNGFILSRIYKDEARSGTSTTGRDQFLAMMDYFSNHPQEKGIVFWELSRFSRDYNDCQYYLADLRRQGFTVHSMTDNIPPGLDGQMLESLKIWMNAKYIEDLKKNIIRGQRYIREVHHANLGVIPIGFKGLSQQIGTRNDGSPHIIQILVPDPEAAPLVRKAFEMRASGATHVEIDQELHLFETISAYGTFLKNTKYIGKWRGIENYCEPLITEELFAQVQAVNRSHASRCGYNHPRQLRSRFFLSGLIFCKRCGKPMYANSSENKQNKTYDYYICTTYTNGTCASKRIPKAQVEELIINRVWLMLMHPDSLQSIYDHIEKHRTDPIIEKDTIKNKVSAELKVINIQITNILSAIKDTGHSPAMLIELKTLESKKGELEGQIANIEMESVKRSHPRFEDFIHQLKPNLEGASERDKALLVRNLIDSIRVEKKDGVISGEINWIFHADNGEEVVIPLPL